LLNEVLIQVLNVLILAREFKWSMPMRNFYMV